MSPRRRIELRYAVAHLLAAGMMIAFAAAPEFTGRNDPRQHYQASRNRETSFHRGFTGRARTNRLSLNPTCRAGSAPEITPRFRPWA